MMRLWQTGQALLLRLLPEHIRHKRGLYVVLVMLMTALGSYLASGDTPSDAGRWMNWGFSVFMLFLLLSFLKGLPLEKVLSMGVLVGALYLVVVSLTEGGILSSTLAWVPLLPLCFFFLASPRVGRLWTVIGALLYLLVAITTWLWMDRLPDVNTPMLARLSVVDYLFATLAIYLVPFFYQQDFEHHLAEGQLRQQQLQDDQRALEHALQMREHFIATVSHELRTPMNAILGLNAVLLERVKNKPQATRVLDYTRQSADHLMTVINDVLDYSQFHSGQLRAHSESFALHETVRAAFGLFQPQVESTRVHYVCDIAPDVPQWVESDRHRLMQVLVNLLGNAIKFTPRGQVSLRVSLCDGGVAFAVHDTGIGIAQDQQQHIFERFGQADASIRSRFGGSGLGLTISQRLVQMMGGELMLQSQEGQGSCFSFCLPLRTVAAPPQHEHLANTATAGDGQQVRRFLVVDDNPVNRLLARLALLRRWPQAQVQEAEDGALALQQIEVSAPFDLVLMDMVMPVMDGIETTQRIRAHHQAPVRATPVLGLTANVNAQDLERFRAAGLNELMLKPFEPAQLCNQVELLLLAAAGDA